MKVSVLWLSEFWPTPVPLLPLRPIKGWLVASQFVNRAQEAGTQQLWSNMHGGEGNDFDQ